MNKSSIIALVTFTMSIGVFVQAAEKPSPSLTLINNVNIFDGKTDKLDDKKAEAAFKERTLINTNCDLSKPEITVRFYLGDEGEIPGTNHIKTRMSEPFNFGFD